MLKGFRIVARRYRTKLGEIDLIARRGDLVLIVEVKARKTLIEAMEAIAHESERRIEGAADLWLARQNDYGRAVGALRHGRGAALALAGACRECFLRAELGIRVRPGLNAAPAAVYRRSARATCRKPETEMSPSRPTEQRRTQPVLQRRALERGVGILFNGKERTTSANTA